MLVFFYRKSVFLLCSSVAFSFLAIDEHRLNTEKNELTRGMIVGFISGINPCFIRVFPWLLIFFSHGLTQIEQGR